LNNNNNNKKNIYTSTFNNHVTPGLTKSMAMFLFFLHLCRKNKQKKQKKN